MKKKLFDGLPDNFKRCCNRERAITKETLTSTSTFKEREIYILECTNPKCKSKKAVEVYTNRNDMPIIQLLEKTKQVNSRLEEIENQKIEVKSYRQPKTDDAIGFTYIDGSEYELIAARAFGEGKQQPTKGMMSTPVRRFSSNQKIKDYDSELNFYTSSCIEDKEEKSLKIA